jgi:hypothetical protein
MCFKGILNSGPPKHAEIAILGNPCRADTVSDIRSEKELKIRFFTLLDYYDIETDHIALYVVQLMPCQS